MTQFKVILERLKNPSVILSIVSQIAGIAVMINPNVKADVITGVAMSICSILVLLGILSNPNTKNKGFGDDILMCSKCGKPSVHIEVAGQMVCQECGAVYMEPTDQTTTNQ